ncbi:hypothetical protein MNBD_ALPHA11-929 [hydrothermal vent metagenome]|uniref:Uncharacterized protein n=1 Tax=hydrothermal vent metagenome TaxID=652676 RepID=A0A3B0U821_9ZZZZ
MKLFVFIFVAIFFLQAPILAIAQEVVHPEPAARISRPDAPTAQNTTNNLGQNSGAIQELYPDRETQNQPPAQQTAPAPGPEQPVTLSAAIKENGAIVPNGLIWRVFDTKTDETGQLALLFRSEEANPSLSLPPGEYVVHASYGRAQSSDALSVVVGPNFKTIILDAGALRLKSAVSNQVDIPSQQLKFDIFAEGSEGDQVPVVLNINDSELIYLNAGIYQVVSRWGNENATVKADIRVEPGQITEATLFHNAAQVSFSLVSNIGGEAIADVDWQVQNMDGQTLYTHLGAFPSAILAVGDYVVFAQSGDQVYNREFQVQAGLPVNIEVLTSVY